MLLQPLLESCRLFLVAPSFHKERGNGGPVLMWLDLRSKAEVDALYEEWRGDQSHRVVRAWIEVLGSSRGHRRRSRR